MITTLFFDIDDTLLDFGAAEHAAITETLSAIGIPPEDAVIRRYCEINDALWKRLERGEITRGEILVGRFERLFSEIGCSGDAAATQDLYFSLLSGQSMRVDGADALLKALYGRYRMCAVSNGTTVIQEKRIAGSGIGRYFERIFLSQEIGYEKPHPAFFDACFAAMPQLSREEVLIIGDSLTSDIRGGANAGIRTCWFNPHGKENTVGVRVYYEIRELSALPALLEEIG